MGSILYEWFFFASVLLTAIVCFHSEGQKRNERTTSRPKGIHWEPWQHNAHKKRKPSSARMCYSSPVRGQGTRVGVRAQSQPPRLQKYLASLLLVSLSGRRLKTEPGHGSGGSAGWMPEPARGNIGRRPTSSFFARCVTFRPWFHRRPARWAFGSLLRHHLSRKRQVRLQTAAISTTSSTARWASRKNHEAARHLTDQGLHAKPDVRPHRRPSERHPPSTVPQPVSHLIQSFVIEAFPTQWGEKALRGRSDGQVGRLIGWCAEARLFEIGTDEPKAGFAASSRPSCKCHEGQGHDAPDAASMGKIAGLTL